MRILYLDPSLSMTLGHHYNVAKVLTEEMRRQGHEVETLVNKRAEPEIEGRRCFRHSVYSTIDKDPSTRAGAAALDVSALLAANDVVDEIYRTKPNLIYAHSVGAAICDGVLRALDSVYGTGPRPPFVAELPFPSETTPGSFYGLQLKGFLERFQQASEHQTSSFYPVTVNSDTSRRLGHATNAHIDTVPSPYSTPKRRSLSNPYKRPIIVGSLGHQNKTKGYHLLPEIVERCRFEEGEVEFLIQTQPGNMEEVTRSLKLLGTAGYGIRLLETPLNNVEYLNASLCIDVMLLPYAPSRYISAISGVCYEALAQGSVVVGPDNTAVGRIIHDYQQNACLFPEWTAEAISESLNQAVEKYQSLSAQACEAAIAYREKNGPEAYVRHLTGTYSMRHAAQPRGKTRVSVAKRLRAAKAKQRKVALKAARLFEKKS
ncbi:MAG: hypothetical protein AAGA97_03990 [Pseudomonadota bacterium]